VVDLGGTLESWPSGSFPNITLVNVVAANGQPLPDWASFVQADACHVPLRGPFDLAYSNSVIEHMGTWERQREFAVEMSRLGRRIYCQTPNRWFPVEPHSPSFSTGCRADGLDLSLTADSRCKA
jgi:hypothetical protein